MNKYELKRKLLDTLALGNEADQIEWAARFLSTMICDDPGMTRPVVARELARCFGPAVDELVAIADPTTCMTDCEDWTADVVGNILLQWLKKWTNEELSSRDMKKVSVDVAEILGPDHAQTLYRFAVSVTRNA